MSACVGASGAYSGLSKTQQALHRQPNSANSQFFICFDEAPRLDRQYSLWGEVTEGMDVVDKINKGGEHNNGAITGEPDKIIKARIEEGA